MKRGTPGFKGDSTRSVHGGEDRLKPVKSLTVPITQTSAYVFENLEEYEAYKAGQTEDLEYARYGTVTQLAAERKLAALDAAEDALLFPTGMSAITSVLLALLRSGQHLIVVQDCYRMTVRFCNVIEKFGIQTSFVEPGDLTALEEAVRPDTRLIFVESPSNLHLRVVDLKRLTALAKDRGIRVLADSTLATPINQRPLEFGADLVVHSATKYLAGHNDVLAGSVCGAAPLIDGIREFRNIAGPTPDPQSSYLLIRGLKTLALRMEKHNGTALQIAQYLEGHKKVTRVHYPGLESHPDHRIAVQQLRGFGGVVSFEIDGDRDRAKEFVHALRIPYLAPSFGGVESLVSYPAIVSYYDLEPEDRLAIGVPDSFVRYSVGIEDAEDLIEDLEQALGRI